MVEQKITCGPHTFKPEDLETAIQFAAYLALPLKIVNVIEAGGTTEGICFGDLRNAGLLGKDYIPGTGYGDDWDPTGIVWTVIGDFEFTTDRGETFKKGDVIEWQK